MNQEDGVSIPAKAPVYPIFPRFLGEYTDPREKLLGLIAYGLYEEARREWVDAFNIREKRYPSAEEVKGYEGSWTASRLDGLKNAAVQLLASYADVIATHVEVQTLRDAQRRGFARELGRWLVGAAVFTLLCVGLFIALGRSGIDIIGTLQGFARPAG
jgi:hypothetical protein